MTASKGSQRTEDGARTFGPLLSFGLWVAALLAASILSLLGRSYRIRIVRGEQTLRQLLAEPRPVLLTFWHNNLFSVAYFVLSHLFRRGFPVTLLASHSRDGELVARVGRLFGFETVRGSASRGGSGALRRLYRVVTRRRSSPITIPDGPRGPIYTCKPGVVVLAQMSGAPFLPLACHVESAWRLSSWDRLIIPRPFTRIAVAVGEPFTVPQELPKEELEFEMKRVEETLNRLAETARRAHLAAGA